MVREEPLWRAGRGQTTETIFPRNRRRIHKIRGRFRGCCDNTPPTSGPTRLWWDEGRGGRVSVVQVVGSPARPEQEFGRRSCSENRPLRGDLREAHPRRTSSTHCAEPLRNSVAADLWCFQESQTQRHSNSTSSVRTTSSTRRGEETRQEPACIRVSTMTRTSFTVTTRIRKILPLPPLTLGARQRRPRRPILCSSPEMRTPGPSHPAP